MGNTAASVSHCPTRPASALACLADASVPAATTTPVVTSPVRRRATASANPRSRTATASPSATASGSARSRPRTAAAAASAPPEAAVHPTRVAGLTFFAWHPTSAAAVSPAAAAAPSRTARPPLRRSFGDPAAAMRWTTSSGSGSGRGGAAAALSPYAVPLVRTDRRSLLTYLPRLRLLLFTHCPLLARGAVWHGTYNAAHRGWRDCFCSRRPATGIPRTVRAGVR